MLVASLIFYIMVYMCYIYLIGIIGFYFAVTKCSGVNKHISLKKK